MNQRQNVLLCTYRQDMRYIHTVKNLQFYKFRDINTAHNSLRLHAHTCRHFPECPLTERALRTSRGCPVVQIPESGPSCGGTCGPGSVEQQCMWRCVCVCWGVQCMNCANWNIFFTVWAPTTVSCVSSSVSQTRLLESRGREQSEPAQVSEHTHTPRDWHKQNMLVRKICSFLFGVISWTTGRIKT